MRSPWFCGGVRVMRSPGFCGGVRGMRSPWFCGGIRVVHHFSFVVLFMCPCVLICLCEDALFTLFVFVYVWWCPTHVVFVYVVCVCSRMVS